MTWPNLLSVLRIAMVPLFIIAVVERHPGWAFGVFALAGFTDLLDGYIARFYGQQSVLGAYLDPAADKLLVTSAFVLLSWPGLHQGLTIPIWVTVLVISRDVIIVIVALIVRLTVGLKRFPPTRISKWNTAFQIATVVAYLLTGLTREVDVLARGVLTVMVVLTVASSLEYAYKFIYRANDLPARAEAEDDETL
ncbi:MAG: CDP-alcohol phosphatidyltransferase family protein [bacterium]|nr:CDP-alcohol phosphatidyltransferase family protein [bacterium]